jgi:hypothetical protein
MTAPRNGEIVRQWGSEERTFRLGIGEWRKIQETCDAGPGEIAQRIAAWAAVRVALPKAGFVELLAAGGAGKWRVDDVREVLYRGLTGGGMEPTVAGRLVRELHDERPLLENLPLALEIVLASLSGPPDEDVGEREGEPPTTTSSTSSPEEKSASRTTTERAA